MQPTLQFFTGRAEDAVVCINPTQRVSTLLKLLKLTGTTFSLTEATAAVAATAVAATAGGAGDRTDDRTDDRTGDKKDDEDDKEDDKKDDNDQDDNDGDGDDDGDDDDEEEEEEMVLVRVVRKETFDVPVWGEMSMVMERVQEAWQLPNIRLSPNGFFGRHYDLTGGEDVSRFHD